MQNRLRRLHFSDTSELLIGEQFGAALCHFENRKNVKNRPRRLHFSDTSEFLIGEQFDAALCRIQEVIYVDSR